MLTVATMILCGDVTDSRLDWFLPIAVGGRRPLRVPHGRPEARWALPRDLANVLALGTLGLLYRRVQDRREPADPLPGPLGDLTCCSSSASCPRRPADDWFLFLLGLTQVLIGSVINQGDTLGVWLFLWAMLAVWVLGQFFLQRESRRFEPEPASAAVLGQAAHGRPVSRAVRFALRRGHAPRARADARCWAASSSCSCPASPAPPGTGRPARWPST